jgi:hypothetical protein
MRRIIFIYCSFVLLLTVNLTAQISLPVKQNKLLENDIAILNKNFKKYATFILEKENLMDNLYKNGKSSFRLNIDKERDWTIELQFNDMRSPGYVATYETEKGTFEYKNYILNTFKGNTSDGRMARFTIDKDGFVFRYLLSQT